MCNGQRVIIGVHSGHDSGACLLIGNMLKNAIAKERLTRKKHDSGEPVQCVEYLLDSNDIRKEDVDLVVRCNWFDAKELADDYYKDFPRVEVSYQHHLFHAYACTLVNPCADKLIFVYDGRGCRECDAAQSTESDLFECESVYLYKGMRLQTLEKRYARHFHNAYKWGSHLDSIGYAYTAVGKSIFGGYHAEGKVMALASYGTNNAAVPKALNYTADTNLQINKEWLSFLNDNYPMQYETQAAKDVSFCIQRELEQYMKFRIKNACYKYQCFDIGLSGGTALNCKNNGLLANENWLSSCSIFPACADDGICVGAALWGMRHLFGDYSPVSWTYSMGRCTAKTQYDEKSLTIAAKMLFEGKIIGLFESGSEMGPRALCNRSIIASPYIPAMKDILNCRIKKREPFRPFGGVVLAKNLSRLTDERLASDLMLSACHVLPEYRHQIQSLVHADGTVRLQVVHDEESTIAKLLQIMEREYGDIVLINTSFNAKGEPIVETTEEAIDCALRCGLDYLLLHGIGQEVKL